MIRIDASTFFVIMVSFPVIIIFISWLYVEYKHKTRESKPESQVISRCNICQYNFMRDKDDEICQCPRCGSYIEFKGSKK